MARQLYFRNTLFSDHLIKIVPGTTAATPPGVMPGLYQTNARIASDSRNLIHTVTFHIALTKTNELTLSNAAQAAQEYQGLSGRVQVKDGGSTLLDWLVCTFAQAGALDVLDGFGGRFVSSWPLTFIGELKPSWLV